MTKEEREIRNEIKGYIAKSGWSMTDVVAKMNEDLPEGKKTTVQNISNKLSRGTIKYVEAKKIADITGYKIEWIEQLIEPVKEI